MKRTTRRSSDVYYRPTPRNGMRRGARDDGTCLCFNVKLPGEIVIIIDIAAKLTLYEHTTTARVGLQCTVAYH